MAITQTTSQLLSTTCPSNTIPPSLIFNTSNASVIFGNYTDNFNNASIEYNSASIPFDTGSNAEEVEVYSYRDMFAMTGRPILLSRNECNDVADGLLGSRGQDSYSMHILKLDMTTTLSGSHGNITCVVNSVYLDSSPARSVTTKYDRYVTSLDTRRVLDDIWGNQLINNSKSQQPAVVTCDEGIKESEPTLDLNAYGHKLWFHLEPTKGSESACHQLLLYILSASNHVNNVFVTQNIRNRSTTSYNKE